MVLHDDRIDQEFLVPLRLTDNIPKDHMCFFVRDLVETYDFSQIHSKYKSTAGKKAYSRKMLTRLVLLATVDGFESSRKIARLEKENIVYMWITGMFTPSYRTILNFKRENKELIEDLLAISIQAARDEGLVKLGVIGIDGTIIKANASNNSTVSEKDLEVARELINRGLKKDKEEDDLYGDGEEDDGETHFKLKNKVKNLVKQIQTKEENLENPDEMDLSQETLDLINKFTKQDIERLKTAHQEVKEIKKQHERSKNADMKNKEIRVSLTDPYSRFMKNKKGKTELSYNIQNIVDCESGIILKTTLTQDPTDHYQLIPQLENITAIEKYRHKKKQKYQPIMHIIHKKAYEYAYLNHFDLYTPNRKQASENKKKRKKDENKFSKAYFDFDQKKNQYTCPNKHILPYKNSYTHNTKVKKGLLY